MVRLYIQFRSTIEEDESHITFSNNYDSVYTALRAIDTLNFPINLTNTRIHSIDIREYDKNDFIVGG